MKQKKTLAVILIMALSLSLCACGSNTNSPNTGDKSISKPEVRIALQYGLGYAPLQIMKEKKLMEKYLPGVKVEWKELGSGPVIRDAMIANQLDIGFMGISPFLIGWDKGVEWKIATASVCSPISLVSYKEELQSVADLTPNDRIASPAIASIQHILLSMAAEKEGKDPRAFDKQQVGMTHPDAMAALLSKRDLSAHFSTPPYLYEELQTEGIHEVLSGEEAFGGEFTFIFGIATERFHTEQPGVYACFIAAFEEAIAFINEHPEEAARILAPQYKLSPEITLEYLTWEGTNYTSTPYGLLGLAEFMLQAGFISKQPSDLSEIAFENIRATIGKRQGQASGVENLQLRN